MKNFVIIGAAGYIAKRHIEAIHYIGGNLIAACDPCDSIGIIDKYYDDVQYFENLELLDEYLEDKVIDYVVVCSPNYLHYAHTKWGLNIGADVICEKPLAMSRFQIDKMIHLESKTGKKVHPILQARIHPVIQKLKKKLSKDDKKVYDVELWYMSKRGDWYFKSWKGNLRKAGGVMANIGIHGVDILFYLFGGWTSNFKTDMDGVRNSVWVNVVLGLRQARVKMYISVNKNRFPKWAGGKVLRMLRIKGVGDFDFSKGFGDLHKPLYKKIVDGEWNIDLDNLKPLIGICIADKDY